MDPYLRHSNVLFHEKLGGGGAGGGAVNRVTFKRPYRGYREAAAKSMMQIANAEVEVIKRLDHPNLVPLLGYYQLGLANILLLEYAPNGSLHDHLKDPSKPVSQQTTWKWLGEAADGLEYLHGLNILHRNIKSKNSLLFEDNVLKLSDFGLVREIDKAESDQKGSFRYMAPEIRRGNEQQGEQEGQGIYSKASDIYAYGMLTLEIVTRRLPFAGMDWQTVMDRVAKGKRPRIPLTCPKSVANLIQGCWSEEPKQRPTIREINQVLYPEMTITEHYGKPKVRTVTMPETNIDRMVCNPDGSTVFVERTDKCLHMFSDSGYHKRIPMPQLYTVQDIAVSPEGHTLVLTYSKQTNDVHVFNPAGKYDHRFSIIKPELPSSQCITTNSEGQLLVAYHRRVKSWINIYNDAHLEPRVGTVVRCKKTIKRMAVTSRNHILCTYESKKYKSDQVQAINYSGIKIFKIKPKVARAAEHFNNDIVGIVCDSQDNIYIAIWGRKRRNGAVSHVHQYSSTGKFVGCIHLETGYACDLSIAPDGALVLAINSKLVRIYCPFS